jgi:N-acetylmuramoyl-L-alanine amidase
VLSRLSGLLVCLVLLGLALPVVALTTADEQVSQLSSDLRVRVLAGRELELEVLTRSGDDYDTVARRVAGGEMAVEAIAAWNRGKSVAPGRWVSVPLELLSDGYRRLALLNLFPGDFRDGDDWVHLARAGVLPTYDEGLWQVAEWFTGNGSNFQELMRINGLSSPEVRIGQSIRIPAELLHPAFRNGRHSVDGTLEFGSDSRGPYAGYRLRSGEALYSAVVVRFTGRTEAEDVITLAEMIKERSAIHDLRDIPVGFLIKIPLDLLEPQFLPPNHPRRLEAEAAREELARELARAPVGETRGGLEGVLVIVDPGHGGRDLGTMNNGIWEHDYVYDVACRLRKKLERETAATVIMTLIDEQTGCEPSTTDKLDANQQGTVQTDPPFLAAREGEARIGVNLRWYLANSVYRRETGRGRDANRIVFISLHADSRHPSLSGVMVYVPGADYRTRTYGHTSAQYKKYKEVREKPTVSFSKKQRVRSEAVSRKLAAAIVESFEQHDLPIQPHQPVRHRIIRGKARYVPAVLRGNAVPTKVLVEMVNLSHPGDAALLASGRQRNALAASLLDALYLHFGESPSWTAADGSSAKRPPERM